MENIGLGRYIKLRSSKSGGIHVYFSLPKAVNTYNAACLMRWACLKAGLIITPGHLELFPNVKNYVPYDSDNPNQRFSVYNGLRLPCQPGTGSFILDDDFNPVPNGDRIEKFLDWAEHDAERQDFTKFRRYLRTARKRLKKVEKRITKKLSQNAEEWKEDLEAIIATGWTGAGETNNLISHIVRYAIVFMGKAEESLRTWVKHIAVNAPGYEQWCRHKHEIERKIEYWCRSTENHKRYLPYRNFPDKAPFREAYGDVESVIKPKSQNELKAEAASKRIKQAVEKLESEGNLPSGAVARTEAIAEVSKEIFGQSIAKSTLRKRSNLSLWHPKHRVEKSEENDISETQVESDVSYTPKSKMTNFEEVQTQTGSDVSYTLGTMKCEPKAEADGQISVEQAPPRLASQTEHTDTRSPLPHEKLNSGSDSGLASAKQNKPNEDDNAQNELSAQPRTKILSKGLKSFGESFKIQVKLDAKAKKLTDQELDKEYPNEKLVPREIKSEIESKHRANLYWESGIPRLMKKAEKIWADFF